MEPNERVEFLIEYTKVLTRLGEENMIDSRLLDRAVAELDRLLIKNYEEQ